MKRLKALCLALLAAYCLTAVTYGTDLFSVRTALDTKAPVRECTISMSGEQVLEFSARDLELRMGLAENSLTGATVTALPQVAQGALFLEGVEVETYQFLSRDDLDELCFVANETAQTADFTLLPQGHDSAATRISISILHVHNEAPTVESVSFTTLQNTALTGFIPAQDPDGDPITIQVVRAPGKGAVRMDGQTFVYDPFLDQTGNDSFAVCAVDRYQNYSAEAVITVKIEHNRSGFFYLDMLGNPSQYAATKLHENGVLSGRRVGNSWFFDPEEPASRGDFLVMLLSAAGLDRDLPATVNTGLPGDAAIPLWLKPYVKRALDEGILEYGVPFTHGEFPIRAEAVVLVDRAANITDVKEFALSMDDASAIPDWARPSYMDLAAYRMLDLYDGSAHPAAALTNAYAADLVWQLYKHCHR